MPSQEQDIEQRLNAVLTKPDNQVCSECDRDYKPIWASFLTCPVDNKVLGMVCCKKCYKLFTKVDGADFTLKSLEDLKDWTTEDIDALELAGNKLVNTCWEATVDKEKDGRDKRKYGYQAFFFEKYVNMTHFDEVVYIKMINQASKALVEKRFNQSLKGYNLKKSAAEDGEHNTSGSTRLDSSEEESEEEEGPPVNRRAGMQRAGSVANRRQTHLSNRRKLSARNLMQAEEGDAPEGRRRRQLSARNLMTAASQEEGDAPARPSMSRHRLNSQRRMEEREERKAERDAERKATNVKDISGDGAPVGREGRMRRKISSRSLSSRSLSSGEEEDEQRGEGRRPTGGRRTMQNGRHRLSKRNLVVS